jgi:hypothetical protein
MAKLTFCDVPIKAQNDIVKNISQATVSADIFVVYVNTNNRVVQNNASSIKPPVLSGVMLA